MQPTLAAYIRHGRLGRMTTPAEPLPPTGPTGHREVSLERLAPGRYAVTNPRGGTIRIGRGADADYTSVELLLAGLAGCTAVDVDEVTSRRSEPLRFVVQTSATKVSDDLGNHLDDVVVRFSVDFPADEAGQQAASLVERVVRLSHDKLCTVSRTVMLPTPVTAVVGDTPVATSA
jgi:uncharacterized OsmC-like protein